MGPAAEGNRVDGSFIGGDSLQIGQVHGDVTVVTGDAEASRRDCAPPSAPALIRVRDADPLRLGVHRPIRVTGAEPASLPAYVPRDLDTREGDGLRPLLGTAVRRGGFVVLVGGSSVGKTRSLYEAIHETVPDWWLVHPSDPADLHRLIDLAPPGLVVWLDELQNHLTGRGGLTAATVRALLSREHPTLIVGTLWPHYHATWTAPHSSQGEDDRHRAEREVLKLADIVHVGADFTRAEQERATAVAAADERLRVALASKDFGLTQVIAGAPQLVHRWENAGAYARALMTAAVDATLLGVRSPIPAELLRGAVPGYCSPSERACAPDDWFDQALAYATGSLLGATAALVPVSAGRAMGRPDGYRLADYLVQHTGRVQRAVPPPATFWEACAEHLTDVDDMLGTGRAAVARLRFAAAVPLLRGAVAAGSVSAMQELGELYRRTGDEAGAREMADRLTASEDPRADLHRVLLAGWDFEEIHDLAEAGNQYAVEHIIEYGDPQWAISVLLERMDPQDLGAWYRMAQLLHDEGEDERVVEILDMIFRQVDEPDDDLLMFFTESLRHAGRVERLWELTDCGYFWAAHYLADLLHERGQREEALDVLREFAGQGHRDVDDLLAEFLSEGGHLDELMSRANDGDCRSAVKVARTLHERGRTDEAMALLTPFAEAGEVYAASTLARLAEPCGSVDDLRTRAAAGDRHAAETVIRRFLAAGSCEEALHAATTYKTWSGVETEIVGCLEEHGKADLAIGFLTGKADSDDGYWTYRLAELLRKHGREDELRARVDRGDPGADRELYELLKERGREDEAEALMTKGLTADGRAIRAD